MHGYYTMANSFGLVLEYAGGKDINHFQSAFQRNIIQKKNNYLLSKNENNTKFNFYEQKKPNEWQINFLSENVLLFFSIQIFDVLQILKLSNVVHRDLKLENIFLLRTFQIKVGDFALAKVIKSGESHKTAASGTLIYMSPELFTNKQIKAENVFKQDNYAVGMILFKLATFEFPIDKSYSEDKSKISADLVKECIKKENLSRIINNTREISEDLKDFIFGLLEEDENKRFSIEEIKEHKWLNKKKVKAVKSKIFNNM